jgi:hypothetical protein
MNDGPVNAAHDTCSTARVVDLATGSASFTFDTAGATNDYGVFFVCQQPDVAISLLNPSRRITIQCTSGGASMEFFYQHTPPGVCPSTTSHNNGSGLSCDGSSSATIDEASSGFIIALCRDPALGPATVLLTNQ